MKEQDSRRSLLALIMILVVFSIAFVEDLNAQGVAATKHNDSNAVDDKNHIGKGVLAPLFQTELGTIPPATNPRGKLSQTSSPRISPKVQLSIGTPAVSATQSTSTLSLLSSFEGLNQIQSCPCAPPDVILATGPNQVVEMVNLEGAVFTKQGVFNQTFNLASFFRTGADSISDPKVIFDAGSGRWFASILDITTNSVILGVSSTSNASGVWTFYSISAGGVIPDQPILGVSDDKVAIAANDFSGNLFAGSQFWILNKSQLLAAALSVNFFTSGASTGVFSVHPVQSLSPTTTQFMISNIVSHKIISTSSLRIFSITGVPGVSTVNVVTSDLAVSTIGTVSGGIPGGVQPGTASTIDTADIRVQTAVWTNGTAWLAFDDACTPKGDSQARSCIRLEKIVTSSPPFLSQDFDFGTSRQYNFYPALSVDNKGNLLMVYGYSNSTVFPSIAVTGQLATDPADSLASPHSIKIGTASDTSTRYGDYFGAALDPVDSSIVWVAGEYHNSSTGSCQSFGSCWSTFVGSASMTGFTVSASPNSIKLSAGSPATSNITFTSLNGFAGSVTITSTHGAGITVSLTPTVKNITSASPVSIVLLISVSSNLPPGNYTVVVTGSSKTISRTVSLVLTVFPDFEISPACSCIIIQPGSQLRENLTLSSVNQFSGTVGLSTSLIPMIKGGVTVTLNSSNLTLANGQTETVSILISAGNATGIYSLTLSGSCLSGSCTAPAQQNSIQFSIDVESTASTAAGGGGGRHLLV